MYEPWSQSLRLYQDMFYYPSTSYGRLWPICGQLDDDLQNIHPEQATYPALANTEVQFLVTYKGITRHAH